MNWSILILKSICRRVQLLIVNLQLLWNDLSSFFFSNQLFRFSFSLYYSFKLFFLVNTAYFNDTCSSATYEQSPINSSLGVPCDQNNFDSHKEFYFLHKFCFKQTLPRISNKCYSMQMSNWWVIFETRVIFIKSSDYLSF